MAKLRHDALVVDESRLVHHPYGDRNHNRVSLRFENHFTDDNGHAVDHFDETDERILSVVCVLAQILQRYNALPERTFSNRHIAQNIPHTRPEIGGRIGEAVNAHVPVTIFIHLDDRLELVPARLQLPSIFDHAFDGLFDRDTWKVSAIDPAFRLAHSYWSKTTRAADQRMPDCNSPQKNHRQHRAHRFTPAENVLVGQPTSVLVWTVRKKRSSLLVAMSGQGMSGGRNNPQAAFSRMNARSATLWRAD
ncbi:MAG: hypothetical protein IPM54_43995 [Polyangiaceae bacterium]|nr:hypothetical protein [Polyangiaceae bacterium]